MSKKRGVPKESVQAAGYVAELSYKAACHDEEQRYFGRVFMCDMWTIVLGRMGYGEKRFEKIDKLLGEVCDEYSSDIVAGSKEDNDVWYQKKQLDREIEKYVGKRFVSWDKRYGFKPPKPRPFTNAVDIRTMPDKDLAHFLATWEPKGEEEILEWLKQEVIDG